MPAGLARKLLDEVQCDHQSRLLECQLAVKDVSVPFDIFRHIYVNYNMLIADLQLGLEKNWNTDLHMLSDNAQVMHPTSWKVHHQDRPHVTCGDLFPVQQQTVVHERSHIHAHCDSTLPSKAALRISNACMQ